MPNMAPTMKWMEGSRIPKTLSNKIRNAAMTMVWARNISKLFTPQSLRKASLAVWLSHADAPMTAPLPVKNDINPISMRFGAGRTRKWNRFANKSANAMMGKYFEYFAKVCCIGLKPILPRLNQKR